MVAAIGFFWAMSQHGSAEVQQMRVVSVSERTENGTDHKGRPTTEHVRELLVTSELTPQPGPGLTAVPPRGAAPPPSQVMVEDQLVFDNPAPGDVVDVYVDPSNVDAAELRGTNAGHLFAVLFGLIGMGVFLSGIRSVIAPRLIRNRGAIPPAADAVPPGPFS